MRILCLYDKLNNSLKKLIYNVYLDKVNNKNNFNWIKYIPKALLYT